MLLFAAILPVTSVFPSLFLLCVRPVAPSLLFSSFPQVIRGQDASACQRLTVLHVRRCRSERQREREREREGGREGRGEKERKRRRGKKQRKEDVASCFFPQFPRRNRGWLSCPARCQADNERKIIKRWTIIKWWNVYSGQRLVSSVDRGRPEERVPRGSASNLHSQPAFSSVRRFRETVDSPIDRRSLNCRVAVPCSRAIRSFLTVSCLYVLMIEQMLHRDRRGFEVPAMMLVNSPRWEKPVDGRTRVQILWESSVVFECCAVSYEIRIRFLIMMLSTGVFKSVCFQSDERTYCSKNSSNCCSKGRRSLPAPIQRTIHVAIGFDRSPNSHPEKSPISRRLVVSLTILSAFTKEIRE